MEGRCYYIPCISITLFPLNLEMARHCLVSHTSCKGEAIDEMPLCVTHLVVSIRWVADLIAREISTTVFGSDM
jgi:hypothetical protein